MLIRKEHTQNGGLLGIWKMEESRETLLQLFPENLRAEAMEYVGGIRSERRAIEWLSTRIMLYVLLGEEKTVLKKENGQPYLTDGSYRISISHTKDYAAILLHRTYPAGIDIETLSERVKNVAKKFISDDEYIDTSQKIVHQLLHWSAKECLYKIMDEEGVDFKQHLHISPFTPAIHGQMNATESKSLHKNSFTVNYEVHPDYVLTWAIEENMGVE